MRCTTCKRGIAAGAEAQKMIVEYSQDDGTTKIFGYLMSDGPLTAATGRILRGWHHKCYHVVRKREARGDAITGRVLAGGPSGYDIGAMALSREDCDALGITAEQAAQVGTAQISDRLARLRTIAQSIGKAVGDLTVIEAFRAEEHGGPYPHTHHLPMEMYQLRAHLTYAHGVTPDVGVRALHNELHAKAALAQRLHDRDNDLGHVEHTERDWRPQLAVDLAELESRGKTA